MIPARLLRERKIFPLFSSIPQSPVSHPSFVSVPSPYMSVKPVSHYIHLSKKATKDQQWGKGKYETFSESLHHFLCLTDTLLPICSLWPTDMKEFSIPWNIWKSSIRVLFCFSSMLMAILIDSSLGTLLGKFHFLTGCRKCFMSTSNKVVLHKTVQMNAYAWCSFCVSHP